MGASVLTVCELLEVGWSHLMQNLCRLEPTPTNNPPLDADMQKALDKLRVPDASDDLWGVPITPISQVSTDKKSLTFRNLQMSKTSLEQDQCDYISVYQHDWKKRKNHIYYN
jgi:hypothetical protein